MQERAVAAVLDAIGHVPGLWEQYVVKGGLALRYVYGSPRETQDLDFNAIHDYTPTITPEKVEHLHGFCDRLTRGLIEAAPRHGFADLRVQHREMSREIPVLFAHIGYAETGGLVAPYEQFVDMQVTLSDMICETRKGEFAGVPIHVPALEDILADKLKVLIQQPLRRTFRSSDLFDLWFYHTTNGTLDRRKLTRFLKEKSSKWTDVLPITKAKYRDPAVRAHVAVHFDEIQNQLGNGFRLPDIDEALASVLDLVDSLDLPD